MQIHGLHDLGLQFGQGVFGPTQGRRLDVDLAGGPHLGVDLSDFTAPAACNACASVMAAYNRPTPSFSRETVSGAKQHAHPD